MSTAVQIQYNQGWLDIKWDTSDLKKMFSYVRQTRCVNSKSWLLRPQTSQKSFEHFQYDFISLAAVRSLPYCMYQRVPRRAPNKHSAPQEIHPLYNTVLSWLKKKWLQNILSPTVPVFGTEDFGKQLAPGPFQRNWRGAVCFAAAPTLGKLLHCHTQGSWTSLSSENRLGPSVRPSVAAAQSAQFLQCKETSSGGTDTAPPPPPPPLHPSPTLPRPDYSLIALHLMCVEHILC